MSSFQPDPYIDELETENLRLWDTIAEMLGIIREAERRGLRATWKSTFFPRELGLVVLPHAFTSCEKDGDSTYENSYKDCLRCELFERLGGKLPK